LTKKYTILGGGLAGVSASFHLGHENCQIFEKNSYNGGHIFSELKHDFTWDEGPHVSFTKNEYVKRLFEKSVDREYLEYDVKPTNYFNGMWIPHPIQSNLYFLPKNLRTNCFNDLLNARKNISDEEINNYDSWLRRAFGNTFTDTFPVSYTLKYWTVHPRELMTEWIGERVYYPSIDDIKKSLKGPLDKGTHYIQNVRYPKKGGFNVFAKIFYNQSNIQKNKEVNRIDLKEKIVFFEDGTLTKYEKLINTLPLPSFLELSDISDASKEAASSLKCSSLLLVNVVANHRTIRPDNWIYVYDEDKYSTRINCTELLAPNNGVKGKTGLQVEVYFSHHRKKMESDMEIAQNVIKELIEMGLIKDKSLVESFFTRWVPWGNVIFNHDYKSSLNVALRELENFGLERESDDLDPTTNWDQKLGVNLKLGSIILAGRYGQWKYYWTDDCVLRGKIISNSLSKK